MRSCATPSSPLTRLQTCRFGYCFFDRSMEEAVSREDQIERELRQALEDPEQSQVFLVFQPKVDLRDDRIVGFEALARLNSEVFGPVSPMEFVEVAEKKMLIVPFSNLILRMAGRFARTLEDHGLDGGKVAVNISGLQLLRDDFTDTVLQLVGESGPRPEDRAGDNRVGLLQRLRPSMLACGVCARMASTSCSTTSA